MEAILGKNGIRGLTTATMLLAAVVASCATGAPEYQPDGRDLRVDPDGEDGPAGTACRSDPDCDDLAFCNGIERCVRGTCVAAERRACDDGVDCTLDRCEEGDDSCTHTPDPSRCTGGAFCDPTAGCGTSTCSTHADCDDGTFCNGAETCGSDGRCVPGTPVSCEDGEACTIDRCDTATDTCTHVPRDADRDGFVDQRCAGGNDCDDRNDAVHPGATEICDDRADNNCDTLPDCRDTACASFPACAGSSGGTPEDCTNGSDDDGDTQADCTDPDCARASACAGGGTGSDGGRPPGGGGSGTGGDRGTDGRPPRDGGTGGGCGSVTYEGSCEGTTLVWCADGAVQRYDCAADGETCGWQDDVVGYNCINATGTDCGDVDWLGRCVGDILLWCRDGTLETYDCWLDGMTCDWQDGTTGYNCIDFGEVCTDGRDNDGDTQIDCDDDDCWDDIDCELCGWEECANDEDDDCDALTDCDDPDCAWDPTCTGEGYDWEWYCDDWYDDDGDGLTDCDDPDCAWDFACGACGDGYCDADEDCTSCPDDCWWLCSYCGDGYCDWDEDCASCPDDCWWLCSYCGDGYCDWDEDCYSCDWDCGACW